MACHNEGRGLGKWITAETAAREVDAELITYGGQAAEMTYGSGAMYVGCKVCGGDEWEAVDVEHVPYGFRDLRAFYDNAQGLWECEDLDLIDTFAAWFNVGANITDLEELIQEHQDRYQGEWYSVRDYAENYAEDTGMLAGLPDHLARYFDFEAFAHDLEHDLHHDGGHIWSNY